MERADAELAATQRSPRGTRYSHYGANGASADRQTETDVHSDDGHYRSNGHTADRDAGVHKLGQAAEYDFDRCHPITVVSSLNGAPC